MLTHTQITIIIWNQVFLSNTLYINLINVYIFDTMCILIFTVLKYKNKAYCKFFYKIKNKKEAYAF